MFQVSEPPAGLERIRLIASDMDATLLDSAGNLPNGVYERVCRLRELGVTFAIASGRPIVTLQGLFPRLRSEIMLVGDNGGSVCDRDKLIYWADLPVADYQRMVSLAHGRGDVPMVCCEDATVFEERYRCYDDVYAAFYYARDYVEDLSSLSRRANKFTVYLPAGDSVERVADTYGPAFGDDYSVVSSGAVWIDIMPKGVDKGGAMRRVSELEGVALEDMMAFGDTFNDASMLEAVGFGYMVANATPGMERFANYVAPSNDEHGVLKVIDQVIAAKS